MSAEKYENKSIKEIHQLLKSRFTTLEWNTICAVIEECDFDIEMTLDRLEKLKNIESVEETPAQEIRNTKRTRSYNTKTEVETKKQEQEKESSEEEASLPAKRARRTPQSKVEKKLTKALEKTFYFVPESEEVIEDEKLEVIGEQAEEEEDDEEDEEDEEKRTLPMRTLDNFVLYDIADNRRIRTLDDIGEGDMEICASGNLKAIFIGSEGDDEVDELDEGDDEDGDNMSESAPATISVQLTCIFFSQVYMNANGESEIWLQTQYAWYKLGRPSMQYKPFYDPAFARIRIANVAETVLTQDENTSYQAFFKRLTNIEGSSSRGSSDYSIKLREEDVKTHVGYVIEELGIWATEFDKLDILHQPLMERLLKIQNETKKNPLKSAEDTSSRQTVRNMNIKVLEKPNPTCVTPHVAMIAKDMFSRRLVKIKEAAEEAESTIHETFVSSLHKETSYKSFTNKIRWNCKPFKKNGTRTYYNSVVIDGELMKTNDCIYLRNDTEEPWFARIIYMYEDSDSDEQFMFHARYFSHGKETLLQEFAGKRELFLLDSCSDNSLSCIMGKCQLVRLGADEREPIEFKQKNWWFYRFWYDTEYAVYEDVKLHEIEGGSDIDNDYEGCFSCKTIQEKHACEEIQWLKTTSQQKTGLKFKKQEYHLHDFVYILTDIANSPYQIGQIMSFEGCEVKNDAPVKRRKGKSGENKYPTILMPARVQVRLFDRTENIIDFNYYDHINSNDITAKESRRVCMTDKESTINVALLEGTCWVEHTSDIPDLIEYKENPNNFYISTKYTNEEFENIDKSELKQCSSCKQGRKERIEKSAQFMNSSVKLVGLDIFSGCGGLTCGMDMTKVVDTKYAIEFSPSASISFEKNVPGSIAYNQCANVLLERAIAQHGRKESLEKLNDHLGRPLKDMPTPGDVDFIYCGPPCQGFSGVNRFKKADDIKNTLVCTALSYVDFYKPKYFLLENVRGLLMYKLAGEQDGASRIKGGIEMGVLKYILRCLTSMGYQTRFSIQQAGQHGVAQSRRRLFIWGTKIGSKLPDFPQPTTCFPKSSSLSVTLPDGTAFSYVHRTNGQAPLPNLTVGDSISDLPAFEYLNPHEVYPETDNDRAIAAASNVPRLKGFKVSLVGYPVQSYIHPPLTDLQQWFRLGSEQLKNHVSRSFNSVNIERISNIKMAPNSDHTGLPHKLKPWCLSHKDSAASRHNGWKGLYGRLDFNGQFQTTLTEMSPMGKQGTVLHPNQRRVLSVREYARAQGFPDTFLFCSTAPDTSSQSCKDMYRQIGNAVPVPLAFALGKELRAALQEDWLKAQEI
ncbi:S-adenosyl-L-methionine-dependent methyltransferase [Spinellus fusiger]|nr:S-adenosyl-L-methionine-dependent methyltransferase [Spinellus fusiger]